MDIGIATNFPRVQRKLDQLHDDVASKALASSVNKTLAQAKTEMSREIRREFKLTARKVGEKLFIKKASFKAGRFSIEGSLSSRGTNGRRALNVINFSAKQVGTGVSVAIRRGQRKVIKGAFIGNQGRTVFERRGKERLPIDPVQTIDVPQMFNKRRIKAAVQRFMREKFPTLFDRDVRFYVQRFNRG